MNSITKKISLLLLLSSVLFLSSCLDSSENSYLQQNEYSYIDRDMVSGIVYATTASFNYITSPEINLLAPGTIATLTYEINKDTETIPLGDNSRVHKVELGAKPVILDQIEPHVGIPAPETDSLYFEALMTPPAWFTQSSMHFGHRWPFTYRYNAIKGESANISFYKVPEDEHPKGLNADILIDIRLENNNPQGTEKDELKEASTVVNLSRILNTFSGTNNMETKNIAVKYKNIAVKYRYFRLNYKKEIELHTTEPITVVVPK